MVDDMIFCKSFLFNNYHFMNYKYTDNSAGIYIHYFAYMTKGHAKLCTKDETVHISQGDTFYIPNGCKYRSYWYGEPEIEFISLGFRFMPNFQNRYFVPQVIAKSENEIEVMREIVQCGAMDSVTVGKFYMLVGRLVQKMQYQYQDRQTELIEKVKYLLALHPDYAISDIAKECAVSESALYSAFRKHSEKSIHEIKKGIIMEASKNLLVSTDYTIEEISRRQNFSSSVYFRKCFKEYFGLSPREMRKTYSI